MRYERERLSSRERFDIFFMYMHHSSLILTINIFLSVIIAQLTHNFYRFLWIFFFDEFWVCFMMRLIFFSLENNKLTKTKSLLLLVILWRGALECWWWEICCGRGVCRAANTRTNRGRFIREIIGIIAEDFAATIRIIIIIALGQCRRQFVKYEIAVLCIARAVHVQALLLQWRWVSLQERLKGRRIGM